MCTIDSIIHYEDTSHTDLTYSPLVTSRGDESTSLDPWYVNDTIDSFLAY